MIKKVFGSILAITVCILMTVGCTVREIEVIFKDIPKEEIVEEEPVETPVVTDPGEDPEYGEFSMYDETIGQLMIWQDEDQVIGFIGQPSESTDPAIRPADGMMHKTCKYDSLGIEIDFYETNDKFLVSSIWAKAPFSGSTSRGIGIGSSEADVMAVYGNDVNTEEMGASKDRIIIGSIYGGLILTMENGKVVSMFLGASAE